MDLTDIEYEGTYWSQLAATIQSLAALDTVMNSRVSEEARNFFSCKVSSRRRILLNDTSQLKQGDRLTDTSNTVRLCTFEKRRKKMGCTAVMVGWYM
jgi:hypothetical protein